VSDGESFNDMECHAASATAELFFDTSLTFLRCIDLITVW